MTQIKAFLECTPSGHIAKIVYNKEKIITAPWPTAISALLSAEEMLKQRMSDLHIVVLH